MIKSTWKPAEEIRLSLRGAGRVTVISCGTCASLSDTGGERGIRFLEGLCKAWGVEVIASRCLAACCPEEAMRQVLKKYEKHISRSDALVMLCCSGGVKSAFLCAPGVPIVAALDTVGSVPVSHSDDLVARSTCYYCDHCVLTFTGGICPLSECPAKKLFGPCGKYPPQGGRCEVDPARDCIWIEIEKRGDLEALRRLEELHALGMPERPLLSGQKPSPAFLRSTAGWAVSRARGWSRLSRLVR